MEFHRRRRRRGTSLLSTARLTVDDGRARPGRARPVSRLAANPRPQNRERVLPRETVRASTARAPRVPASVQSSTLGSPARSPLPTVRSELVGSSEPPSAAAFATVITHALAKTHGVVGGAIPIDHLSFEPEIGGTKPGRGRDGTTGCGCGVGVARCHVGDARKVRTALAMLTTTHDGTECRASVLGEARSLVALAGECGARDLARRLIIERPPYS